MIHHASPIYLYIITACYFIFAGQILWQTKWSKANSTEIFALGSLVVVMVSCGLAGYISTLLGPEWYWAREVMHLILSAAALALVISNRAKVISRMLDRQ